MQRMAALPRRMRDWHRTWVDNGDSDLPRFRVLLAFPVVIIVLMGIAISLGLNGTSSGYLYDQVFEGRDPALIAGHPQDIRSDEWNVGAVWTISQAEQGFPTVNESMPGGMDAAIPQDLPRADWSVAFRPHHLGYLFLPLDQATAWKWWLPAGSVVIFAYLFMLTVLPRRPGVSALAAVGFVTAPFFQWWFQTVTFWPTAWGLATMVAAMWAMRAQSCRARWAWAGVAGYLTVVMTMGIYVPYISPVVIVVMLFIVGVLVEQLRQRLSWRPVLRLLPLAIAGALAAATMLLWLRSKQSVIDAFLSTDYPGERLFATGSVSALSAARTIASSFTEALENMRGFLGANSSEASTFFLLGAFLIPAAIWIIVRSARARPHLPWPLIGLLAGFLVLAAFAFVPGWDAVAHLLFLDRSTDTRIRIGLGLVAFAIVPFVVREIDAANMPPRALVAATAGLFALSQLGIAIAFAIFSSVDRLFEVAPLWWLFAALSTASIVLILRNRAVLGLLAFAIVGVLGAVNVNPLYVGLFDLRGSDGARLVERIDATHPGAWVALGSTVPTAILVETGVTTFSGVQGAPAPELWDEVDPDGSYEFQWNRLGNVSWRPYFGEPQVQNPAADQISVTFDACASFAQEHVQYVLSNVPSYRSACAEPISSVELPDSNLTAYLVVPPG